MICAKCQTILPDGAAICPQCIVSVSSSTNPLKASSGSALARLAAIVYLLIVLAFFSFLQLHRQGDWGAAIGYEVGVALIPSIFAFLYYRKKDRVSSARILFVAATWIVFANLVSSRSSGSRFSAADIPVIAKEAVGTVPIADPSDQGRAALRDYFRELIAQNREYESKVATIEWGNLGTPKSYLDPTETDRVLATLREVMLLEKQQEAGLTTITNKFKDRINTLDWSTYDKEQFIEGFDGAYTEILRSRKQALDVECDFLGALQDLYTLVSANRRYFKMSAGKLVVTDDKVLGEFNKDVELTNDRRVKYQSALKTSKQQRDQNVTNLGLSNRDFGLPE